jgi:hypothetical protein
MLLNIAWEAILERNIVSAQLCLIEQSISAGEAFETGSEFVEAIDESVANSAIWYIVRALWYNGTNGGPSQRLVGGTSEEVLCQYIILAFESGATHQFVNAIYAVVEHSVLTTASSNSSKIFDFCSMINFFTSKRKIHDVSLERDECIRTLGEALLDGDSAGLAVNILRLSRLWLEMLFCPDAFDKSGNSFLHIAATFGDEKLCEHLVSGGWNPFARNTAGDQPYLILARNNYNGQSPSKTFTSILEKEATSDDRKRGGEFFTVSSTDLNETDEDWVLPEQLNEFASSWSIESPDFDRLPEASKNSNLEFQALADRKVEHLGNSNVMVRKLTDEICSPGDEAPHVADSRLQLSNSPLLIRSPPKDFVEPSEKPSHALFMLLLEGGPPAAKAILAHFKSADWGKVRSPLTLKQRDGLYWLWNAQGRLPVYLRDAIIDLLCEMEKSGAEPAKIIHEAKVEVHKAIAANTILPSLPKVLAERREFLFSQYDAINAYVQQFSLEHVHSVALARLRTRKGFAAGDLRQIEKIYDAMRKHFSDGSSKNDSSQLSKLQKPPLDMWRAHIALLREIAMREPDFASRKNLTILLNKLMVEDLELASEDSEKLQELAARIFL